jgi:sulfur carrier protein
VQIVVNGRPSQVVDGTSLTALVVGLGLRVGSVLVEHNGTALLRSELPAAVLADGDRLELVRAVAGG